MRQREPDTSELSKTWRRIIKDSSCKLQVIDGIVIEQDLMLLEKIPAGGATSYADDNKRG